MWCNGTLFSTLSRDRVLRLTLCFKSIFEAINEVSIALSSFSRSTSFIGRLRGCPRGHFSTGVFSSSRVISNTCGILYTATPSIQTSFLLIYFFYACKSESNSVNCFFYNILIVLSVSTIRVIRFV